MKKILISLVSLLVLCGWSASAQTPDSGGNDLFKPIARYLGKGDTGHLSAWMAPDLEISVLSTFNITSRDHAIRILDDFFSGHTPAGLTITHIAAQPNLKYAVGTLSAGGEKFAVTLFAAYAEDGGFQIRQIKIERSNSIY